MKQQNKILAKSETQTKSIDRVGCPKKEKKKIREGSTPSLTKKNNISCSPPSPALKKNKITTKKYHSKKQKTKI